MSKKKVKEISATGGGAPAADQGHANPGEGEGMATKFSFGGAGGTKAKRKKRLVVTKKIKEETSLLELYKRLFKKDL